ncbi:MAG TPA: hypothetical protein VIC84_11045 [Blastocatellia bacterium]|jgi:hypothetical protein
MLRQVLKVFCLLCALALGALRALSQARAAVKEGAGVESTPSLTAPLQEVSAKP